MFKPQICLFIKFYILLLQLWQRGSVVVIQLFNSLWIVRAFVRMLLNKIRDILPGLSLTSKFSRTMYNFPGNLGHYMNPYLNTVQKTVSYV